MPHFRQEKQRLMGVLREDGWKNVITAEIAKGDKTSLLRLISPFVSFLNRPELRWQAAFSLGKATARLALADMEAARVVMRRLMWNMNEESGNLGWGIPEAMGCILAESSKLADEYARIFMTYIRDTDREDNFVEHPPLRAGAYWGVGRLSKAAPDKTLSALPSLARALCMEDLYNRAMAAWALTSLAEAAAPSSFALPYQPQWEKAVEYLGKMEEIQSVMLEIMEEEEIFSRSARDVVDAAKQIITNRLQEVAAKP